MASIIKQQEQALQFVYCLSDLLFSVYFSECVCGVCRQRQKLKRFPGPFEIVRREVVVLELLVHLNGI